MSIKRLFDAVERRGDIGRRIAALVLPISNRPRVTSSCTGKIGLREPGEHTSGPNLASRDNVAHIGILNDFRIAGTFEHPIYASAAIRTTVRITDSRTQALKMMTDKAMDNEQTSAKQI